MSVYAQLPVTWLSCCSSRQGGMGIFLFSPPEGPIPMENPLFPRGWGGISPHSCLDWCVQIMSGHPPLQGRPDHNLDLATGR